MEFLGGVSQFKRINSRSAFHVATLCWRFGMASQYATIPIAPCVSHPDSFPHLPHSPGSPEGAEIEIPGRSSTPSSVEQLRDAATRWHHGCVLFNHQASRESFPRARVSQKSISHLPEALLCTSSLTGFLNQSARVHRGSHASYVAAEAQRQRL